MILYSTQNKESLIQMETVFNNVTKEVKEEPLDTEVTIATKKNISIGDFITKKLEPNEANSLLNNMKKVSKKASEELYTLMNLGNDEFVSNIFKTIKAKEKDYEFSKGITFENKNSKSILKILAFSLSSENIANIHTIIWNKTTGNILISNADTISVNATEDSFVEVVRSILEKFLERGNFLYKIGMGKNILEAINRSNIINIFTTPFAEIPDKLKDVTVVDSSVFKIGDTAKSVYFYKNNISIPNRSHKSIIKLSTLLAFDLKRQYMLNSNELLLPQLPSDLNFVYYKAIEAVEVLVNDLEFPSSGIDEILKQLRNEKETLRNEIFNKYDYYELSEEAKIINLYEN